MGQKPVETPVPTHSAEVFSAPSNGAESGAAMPIATSPHANPAKTQEAFCERFGVNSHFLLKFSDSTAKMYIETLGYLK